MGRSPHTVNELNLPSPWNRQLMVDLLLRAGRIALGYRGKIVRELKEDRSIVTQADREIEELVSRELERPEEGVYLIGEESIAQKGEEYLEQALEKVAYAVDPIDGTAPYAHALPHWGISIGRMEAARLTDGAVFLPEIREGEMVVSDGPAVLEGICAGGAWSFRELHRPPLEEGAGALIAITQDLAKRGRISCPNPVQALGTAVLPLVSILQGRVLAYVGTLKLWDLAGCLPLLARLGFSMTHLGDKKLGPLGLEVTEDHYELDKRHQFRWGVKAGLLVCPPAAEGWIRKALGGSTCRKSH
ncbi:MAG: hypothetical protein HY717_07625 [Planctomycetes bacterium]|nr:hypothetical protein [Planctomycetota bacterium]